MCFHLCNWSILLFRPQIPSNIFYWTTNGFLPQFFACTDFFTRGLMMVIMTQTGSFILRNKLRLSWQHFISIAFVYINTTGCISLSHRICLLHLRSSATAGFHSFCKISFLMVQTRRQHIFNKSENTSKC